LTDRINAGAREMRMTNHRRAVADREDVLRSDAAEHLVHAEKPALVHGKPAGAKERQTFRSRRPDDQIRVLDASVAERNPRCGRSRVSGRRDRFDPVPLADPRRDHLKTRRSTR
jgi:hypothetical protein